MQHMIDDMGHPRAAVISSQGSIQRGIRHISSNRLDSTRSAIWLILALENSLKLNRFSAILSSFLRNRYGSELSSDTCSIRNTLLSFSFTTIDHLLHYLNSNYRALSIVYTVFDSDEYDTPEELREYTWAEVGHSTTDYTTYLPKRLLSNFPTYDS